MLSENQPDLVHKIDSTMLSCFFHHYDSARSGTTTVDNQQLPNAAKWCDARCS